MHALRYILLLLCPMQVFAQPFAVDPGVALSLTQRPAVTDFVLTSEGRVAVSGQHDRVDGLVQSGVVMLGADGRAISRASPRCGATGFTAVAPCSGSLYPPSDGGVLIAGSFDSVDDRPIKGLAKLDRDGALVADFNPLGAYYGTRRITASVGVGRANTVFVLVQSRNEGGGTVAEVLRINIERGRVEASYAVPPSTTALRAIDAAGFVYAIVDDDLVRLDTTQGDDDTTWSAGVDVLTQWPVVYDPVTDSLFAFAPASNPDPNPVPVRLSTRTPVGYDPNWVPPALYPDGTRWFSLLGAGDGQLLAFAGNAADPLQPTEYVQLHAVDGAVVARRAVAGSTEGRARRMGDGWLIADTRRDAETAIPHGSSLYRVGADLAIDPRFASSLRRAVWANAAARAPDGRIAVVGAYSRVDGYPRERIARLLPTLAVDPQWPAIGQAMTGPYPWTSVAINGNGDIVVADTGIGVQYQGWPQPGISAFATQGTVSRRHFGPFQKIRGGADDRFYFATFESRCNRVLFRSAAATLLTPPPGDPCAFDAAWAPPVAAVRVGSAALEIADRAYYVAKPQAPSSLIHIERYALTADATPDPGWRVAVGAAAGATPSVRALAVAGDWVYLTGSFRTLNGTPVPALARVSRFDASVDTGWTPAVTEPLHAIDVDAHHVHAIRPIGPTYSGQFRAFDLARWSVADDGSSMDVLSTDGYVDLYDGAGSSVPSGADIIALGDGRALIVGNFERIGEYGRRGFAVVGAIEAVFDDGLEAR
jgi:hypothetical protein